MCHQLLRIQKKCRIGPQKLILIIMANITVSVLLILLSLVGYWRIQRTILTEASFCPNEKWINAKHNQNRMRQSIENSVDDKSSREYCGKASDVLVKSVSKFVAEKYNGDMNPEYISLDLKYFNCKVSQRTESVLLLKHLGSHAKPVPGKPTKIFWKSTTNSAGGLIYIEKDGSIYVEQSGIYYISAQLATIRENTNSIKYTEQRIQHLVYLISAKKGKETILLESVSAACETTGKITEKSGNLGAAFELEEKDRIYVATSHPYHLVYGDGRNHFSVHKLWNS